MTDPKEIIDDFIHYVVSNPDYPDIVQKCAKLLGETAADDPHAVYMNAVQMIYGAWLKTQGGAK